MQAELGGDPINTRVYHDLMENWGLYMRLDGTRSLFYKSKTPFLVASNDLSITPCEDDAEAAEDALLAMDAKSSNHALVEWLKIKYFNNFTDSEMARRFGFGATKAKQIKVVALNIFGLYYAGTQ